MKNKIKMQSQSTICFENNSLFRELFMCSSVPMMCFDITNLREKCTELEKIEFIDIDSYINEEILLKKSWFSYLKLLSINNSAVTIFNVNEKELYSSGLRLRQELIDNVGHVILDKIFYNQKNITYEYIDKNNNENRVFNLYIDYIDNDRKLIALVSFFNISSYKESEKILTQFVEKYFLLLKTVKDAILIVSADDGVVIEANDKAVELIGLNINNIIGFSHLLFFAQSDKEKYVNYFNKRVLDEYNSEAFINLFVSRSDGRFIPVQVNVNSSFVGNSRVAQVLIHDMSNKFKMEEGRRLLATAVEQAAESVVITDVFGNIQYVNPAFENISGYSFTEMLGKNPRVLQSGKTPNYQYKLMWQEISSGNVWRGKFINKKKNGEIYNEEATITPVKDNNNNIISYVAVKRDITQQIMLENQIRQSQKMQAIGTLAGGVAHDFNNILTAILGYAELSQSQCDKDSLLYNNLAEIIRGADRAGQLVDQILKFSRQSEKSVSSLKLSLIVKEVFRLLRASLPANIELVFNADDDFYVKADPTQMHQIIMNLCTNAYQALEGKGGLITIGLFKKDVSAQEGVVIGNIPPGSYVCLQVEDNGIGIPSEYLQRIFEPYFTTKKLHEGTGLGLSVVHGIVNDHGGAVTVESVPGQGSCFTVYLPEAKDNAEHLNATGKCKRNKLEGNILVVDDEQPITFFLSQILEHLGYKVVACVTSEAAYEEFARRSDYFDLVITDMGMPGMTGLELSEKIKNIKPAIPIVLCTGFSEQVTADNYRQMGLDGFVHKPFNADSLIKEVTRVMRDH